MGMPGFAGSSATCLQLLACFTRRFRVSILNLFVNRRAENPRHNLWHCLWLLINRNFFWRRLCILMRVIILALLPR